MVPWNQHPLACESLHGIEEAVDSFVSNALSIENIPRHENEINTLFVGQAGESLDSFESSFREEGGFIGLELPKELAYLPVGCV